MAKSTLFLPFAGFRAGGSGSGLGLRRLERVSCVWLLLQEIQMVTSSSNSSKDCQGLRSSEDRSVGCMGGGNHFFGLFTNAFLVLSMVSRGVPYYEYHSFCQELARHEKIGVPTGTPYRLPQRQTSPALLFLPRFLHKKLWNRKIGRLGY